MAESVHEKLREMLDVHPMGCPPAPEIIGILGILFTQDEARVALGLEFRPFSVDEIAARAGNLNRSVMPHARLACYLMVPARFWSNVGLPAT